MSLIGTLAVASVIAKPAVLFLGTYHFANPGLDAVKVTQRDTLGPERQKEILEVVDRLAAFKPNKILLEVTPDRQADLEAQFAAYAAGTGALTASESQQVGFRLAKRFGAKLVAVDYKANMDFDKVFGFAAQNGMPEVPQRMGRLIEAIGKFMTELDQRYTVGQILAIHNAPQMVLQSQRFYTDLLAVAKSPDYPGADVLAGWYRRNLVIYQNIRAALESGDRALVIYGSGHAYYLTQLLRDGGDAELADVTKLLPKPPVTKIPDL